MKKRFLLTVLVGMTISTSSFAGAPTTDVSMQIQSLLDQFSQIRTLYKQIASAESRKALLQNMGKEAFGKLGGKLKDMVLGKAKKTTAKELGTLILPDKLKSSADDVRKSVDAFKEFMTMPENADNVQIAEKREENKRFQYVMYATGYGRSLVARKLLDEKMKAIEKLREDGENAQSENELASLSNALGVMQLEQMETAEMLSAMIDQASNYVQQMPNYNTLVSGNSGSFEE